MDSNYITLIIAGVCFASLLLTILISCLFSKLRNKYVNLHGYDEIPTFNVV